MAALEYQQHARKHGFIHEASDKRSQSHHLVMDIAPLLLVAVVCFLVVAFDVKI